MDASETFWLRIYTLVAAVLIVGISSCTYVSTITKENWKNAVANGADPLVVSCALGVGGVGSSHADAVMCNTIAQNRK